MPYSGDESNPFYSFSLLKIADDNNVELLTKLISLRKSLNKNQAKLQDIGLNQKNDKCKTPLHVAAEKSHHELVEILLNNGADPNAKDEFDRTPLWHLALNGDLEIVKLILKFKADCKFTDSSGSSLLAPATRNLNNLDVLKFLVQNVGLDVNHRDNNGRIPLHEAALNYRSDSHYEVLEFLLESGSDPNARDKDGSTPFWYLVRYGDLEVVELFLKHKADVHTKNNKGQNVLFRFSSVNDNVEVLDKLIHDFDLDVNHRDQNESTPLHSIFKDPEFEPINIGVIKCLLVNGANINAPDENGNTPLINVVRKICENGQHVERKYFDFFIEHIDFGIVRNGLHIFKYNFPCYSKYRSKWILEHLAKLEFSNISVHTIVIEFIYNKTDYKDYFTECIEELEMMKKSKPQNSWINFFNLLVDGRRKLKNYAGNKDLIEDFENNDWLEMFQIYGDTVKKNVEKGLERRKLFDESCILLSDCLPILNPNHLIIKDILDCILSTKDLSKFCE